MTTSPSEPVAVERARLWQPWMIPTGLLLLLFIASVVIYFAANSGGADESRPALKAFSGLSTDNPTLAFDVSGVSNGKLALSAGAKGANSAAVELQPAAGLRAEFIAPATAADIRAGDDIVVIGVTNEVRSFSIRMILVIPAELRAPSGELTQGGFAGSEAEVDQTERVVLRGKVITVSATQLSLTSGGAAVTFDLTPTAPIRKLRSGTAADIRASDRVALHATDSKPDPTKPILVLAGGAQ